MEEDSRGAPMPIRGLCAPAFRAPLHGLHAINFLPSATTSRFARFFAAVLFAMRSAGNEMRFMHRSGFLVLFTSWSLKYSGGPVSVVAETHSFIRVYYLSSFIAAIALVFALA
jgi:hypothetical protein